jgi:ribA/ribD-fused uncharacterized protein
MSETINYFRYEHAYLSNFYPVTILMDGVGYASVEHAYQAAKNKDTKDRWIFTLETNPRLSAGDAKHLGQKVKIRDDWDQVKDQIMRELVMQKFDDNSLTKLLLATGDAHLEEGNYWHDTYWGVCHGKIDGRTCKRISEHLHADDSGEIDPTAISHIGQNKLGLLLMDVRKSFEQLSPNTPLSYNLISGTPPKD